MTKVKEQLKNDPLMPLRHTAEHVLHMAMQELYPSLKKVMGPPIEDGFYFDFDLDTKVSADDFAKIEKLMQEIIDADLPVKRVESSVEKAKNIFKDNEYKIDTVNEIAQRGESVTLYEIGKKGDKHCDLDLCAGPHAKSTGEVKAFKLLSVAGAYYKGSEKNKMLTRIYGTAFSDKKDLDDYIKKQEEAKSRDHRKLGKELDLFVFSDLVGSGLPLFTPKGTIIRKELENFVKALQDKHGYQTVLIPHLAKKELYETSGHWAKYGENMFKVISHDKEEFSLKPMNCPHHTQIYAARPRSYRDLPQRYAEVTAVYRCEKAGELLGLSRVYMLTQDDAHVFCTEEQAIDECLKVYDIIKTFYAALGFGMNMRVRMSLRDPKTPEKYLGSDEQWDKAENMMREVAKTAQLDVYDGIGEAAFYAPKLDFMAYDALGREWQLATIQLDFNQPARFGLEYTDKDGTKKTPVMIHRAILGSVERFMSVLIEHFAGAFPVWLAPVQVQIIPIAEKHVDYGQKLVQLLKEKGLRAEIDDHNETMQSKIRAAQVQKIPYMFVVGDREMENNQVSVRLRSGESYSAQNVADTIDKLNAIYLTKSLNLW